VGRCLILLSGLILVVHSARAGPTAARPAGLFVTPIPRDFEVVTLVSNTNPFVGEQFYVIYSLRAQRAPAAVELDPQQYAGFWTEPAQLPEQPRSTVRLRNGRQVSEYLLRQVMAFPLWAGALELPPLRVKVRIGDSHSSNLDWDSIGLSRSIPVAARAPTPQREHQDLQPLVGELEGSLSAGSSGVRSDLLLELKGTANLALFQPMEWLKTSSQIRWSVRLKGWDNTIQIRDTGDGRQLTLLQWRRWSIRPLMEAGQALRVEDLAIPVFQPQSGQWTTVRIRGLELKNRDSDWPAEIPAEGSGAAAHPDGVPRYVVGTTLLLLAAALTLLLIRFWRGRAGTGRGE
jgi:hypothetical protein